MRRRRSVDRGEFPAHLRGTCPHGWLTSQEFDALAPQARWTLAMERRAQALAAYGRAHGLAVEELAQRLRGPRITDRRQALAHIARHRHEPCSTEAVERARARRRALLRPGHGAQDADERR